MHLTLTGLLWLFEKTVFDRICKETAYYAQNPEQTKKTWFMKRANHPDEYHSVMVQEQFVAFREGFQAAGGTVDDQA